LEINQMKKSFLVIAGLAVCALAQAKETDISVLGPAAAPVIRASETTNINFNGTAPATFAGALDADDSTYNRVTGNCTTLSGLGTAVPFDLVNITNNSGSAGSITIATQLVGGAACTDANDTFMTLYSTFTPATPLANCLALNDDISGATNRCSRLTFPLNAGESRTVVVAGFNNASEPDGLFTYEVNFAGTTGTPGGSGTLSLSNTGNVAFGNVAVGATGSSTLTVSNSAAAGVLNVTALPTPTAPFSRTGGTCTAAPFSLNPGANCTVIYGFTPTAPGAANQVLAVTSNGGNGTVTLTGTGTAPLVATPTMNIIGLAAMGLLLGLFGFVAVRRFS
jgi:hypothetical protein